MARRPRLGEIWRHLSDFPWTGNEARRFVHMYGTLSMGIENGIAQSTHRFAAGAD